MPRPTHPPDSEAAMDEMYAEVLRERAAWKRALRVEVEATLRQAGAAVLDTGDCGCGCKGAGGCGDGRSRGLKRASDRATRRRAAASPYSGTRPKVIDRQPSLEIPEDCVERCGDLVDPADQMACVQACIEEANGWIGEEFPPETEETFPKIGNIPKEMGCPQDNGPYIELPDFYSVSSKTQYCFIEEFGREGWPFTKCCPPELKQTDECEPPSALDIDSILSQIPRYDEMPLERSRFMRFMEPDMADEQLFGAAVSILEKNLDLALWAACLVQS